MREESIKHGTREGTLRGLAVTGAVISGAGIVLAGTFGALAVLPLVVLTQIGFIVAFGVLLDPFIVRSVIVPAAVIVAGCGENVAPYRTGRYFSISHWVSWTRYSSHSLRLSST